MLVEITNEQLQYLYATPLGQIRGKLEFSKDVVKQFKKKVDILIGIAVLSDLRNFGNLHFEKLKGDLRDFYSIRLNIQYRLLFRVIQDEHGGETVEIIQVTEISKHYE